MMSNAVFFLIMFGSFFGALALVLFAFSYVLSKFSFTCHYRIYTNNGVRVIKTKKPFLTTNEVEKKLDCRVYKVVPLRKRIVKVK